MFPYRKSISFYSQCWSNLWTKHFTMLHNNGEPLHAKCDIIIATRNCWLKRNKLWYQAGALLQPQSLSVIQSRIFFREKRLLFNKLDHLKAYSPCLLNYLYRTIRLEYSIASWAMENCSNRFSFSFHRHVDYFAVCYGSRIFSYILWQNFACCICAEISLLLPNINLNLLTQKNLLNHKSTSLRLKM